MAIKGPNAPGTAVDDATVGTLGWSNPNNSKVLDGSKATSIKLMGTGTGQTHYLLVSNFGFSVPLAVTINGIVVNVVYSANNAGFDKDFSVKLMKGGVIGGTNKATAAVIANGTLVYGTSSDLWGQTWTPADINDSTFGFAFSTTIDPSSFNQQDEVDYISITVYHTEVTMTMAQGSYALTGQSTNITRQFYIALTAGMYTLTGQAISFVNFMWTRLAKSVSTFTNRPKS